MNFDYVSLRRLERFFTDLKGWLASKYASKEELEQAIANFGGFEVVSLNQHGYPDVASPSTKVIYLTKETGSQKTDPYTEWICTNVVGPVWEVIGETSPDINEMVGATASTAGTAGLVPAPAAGDQDKVLKGDGTWGDAPSTMRVAYDSENLELQLDFSPLIWKETIGTKQYRVKKYGSKIWMIENYNEPVANYSSLYTGDTDGSVYGRLYVYTTDLSALGVSQSGWRLPTQTDWLDLVEEITGTRPSMNGRALHPEWFVLNEHWTTAWSGDNFNKSGFSVLPAGNRNSDGVYGSRGVDAVFYGDSCRPIVTNSGLDQRVVIESLNNTAPRYSLRFCKDA